MGLLDFMWGSGPTMGSTPPFNPYAPDPRMFDPTEIKKQQARNALMAIGSGLASGRNWQEGISKGLLGGAQQWGGTDDTIMDRQSKLMQMQYMQKQIDAKDKPDLMNVNGHLIQQDSSGGVNEVGYYPDTDTILDGTIGTANGPVDFKYNPVSGQTSLVKPDGNGFYNIKDFGGQAQTQGGGGMQPFEAIIANENPQMDPNAVSPKTDTGYAYGVTQMQPNTFNDEANKAGVPPQLRNQFNPRQSVYLGANHYKGLTDKFGDPVLAAGAYHAGEGNMQSYLQRIGYKPGMTGDEVADRFIKAGYTKTGNYMKKFVQNTGYGVGNSLQGFTKPTKQDAGIQIQTDSGEIITIGGDGLKPTNPLVASTKKALEDGEVAVTQASEMMGMFQVSLEAAKRYPNSGIFGDKALGASRVLSWLGLPNNAKAGEVLKGINAKIATFTRLPGSGSTSNYEMEAYQQSAPGLLNTKEGNIALAKIGMKLLKRRIDNFNKFKEYVASHEGTSIGYVPDDSPVLDDADWDALLGSENPAPAAATTTAPKPGDRDGDYRFLGGDPAVQQNWELIR